MVGSRSGETYRLGDRVTVKLVEAAPVAGALRFELLSEGRAGKTGPPPDETNSASSITVRAANNGRHDDAKTSPRFGPSA